MPNTHMARTSLPSDNKTISQPNSSDEKYQAVNHEEVSKKKLSKMAILVAVCLIVLGIIFIPKISRRINQGKQGSNYDVHNSQTTQYATAVPIVETTAAPTIEPTIAVDPVESQYQQACLYFEQGLYDQALQMFTSLNDYKDSITWSAICEEAIKEDQYNNAVSLFEQGMYEDAYLAFTALGNYLDSEVYSKEADLHTGVWLESEYRECDAYGKVEYFEKTTYDDNMRRKTWQYGSGSKTEEKWEYNYSVSDDYYSEAYVYGQNQWGSLEKWWFAVNTFDKNNNPQKTSFYDVDTNAIGNFYWMYTFDSKSRMTSEKYYESGSLQYTKYWKYDDRFDGYVEEKQTDGDGNIVYWSVIDYDEAGLEIMEKLLDAKGAIAVYTKFDYDNSDHIIGWNSFNADGSKRYTAIYEYDTYGNLTRISRYSASGELLNTYEYAYVHFSTR